MIETLLVQYWAFQGRAAFLGSIIFDPTGPFDPNTSRLAACKAELYMKIR